VQLKAKFPVPTAEAMKAWYPGLTRSKTACESPKMRLICFTNAGNEENVYTNEGLGARKVSTLLEFCRTHQVEMLAVQLPGAPAARPALSALSAGRKDGW
jgi:hypothetical protein